MVQKYKRKRLFHEEEEHLLSDFSESEAEDPEAPEEESEEDIPWKIIFVGSFANAVESFSSSIIYPFISEYCDQWLNVPSNQKEIWSGLLVGIFNIGLAISNPWLGAISDLYGRKPTLLIGMFLSSICTFLLAFVRTPWVAVCLRFFGGFTNANLSVSRALVSDITRHQQTRSLAFTYFAGSFALFRCLATFISGLTVHQTFGVFDSYPYLLPFAITLVLNLSCCICTYFLVSETKRNGFSSSSPTGSPSTISGSITSRPVSQFHLIPGRIVSGMKELVSTPLMRKLTFGMILNHFCSGYVLLLLTLYAQMDRANHGYGFSIAESSYLIAIFGISGFLFQVLFSRKLTKMMAPRHRYILFNSILCLSLLAFPLISLLYWSHTPPSSSSPSPEDFAPSPVSLNLTTTTTTTTSSTSTSSGTSTGSIDERNASSAEDIILEQNEKIMLWLLLSFCCVFGGAAYIYVMPTLTALQSLVISPANFGNSMGTMAGVGQVSRGIGPFVAGMLLTVGNQTNFPFISWFLVIFLYLLCSFILSFLMTPQEKSILDADTQLGKYIVINNDGDEEEDDDADDDDDDDDDDEADNEKKVLVKGKCQSLN